MYDARPDIGEYGRFRRLNCRLSDLIDELLFPVFVFLLIESIGVEVVIGHGDGWEGDPLHPPEEVVSRGRRHCCLSF